MIEIPIAVLVLAKKSELTIATVLVSGGKSCIWTKPIIMKYPEMNKKILRKADRTNSVNCAVMMLDLEAL